jgi:uncharacterized damage-inducible protein DinB
MARILINNLIRQLNELQEGSLWFDQSFRDKINKLSDDEAFAKPLPAIHSVAEHVSHMIEWRKECIRRFKGEKTELMHSPEDWRSNEELKIMGWVNLKNALYNSREELIALFSNQTDDYLGTRFRDTEYNFHYLIEGIIQHDLYHLGQIGITIKLVNEIKDPSMPKN